jgi:starvation-inducible outer membrane lipoprotein
MSRTFIFILTVCFLLVACTAAPTPMPVSTATPAPTNTPVNDLGLLMTGATKEKSKRKHL